ncbi:uncharacterized protein DS421_12g363710 [Arachis hypogaea]|nr:uncharacterized protein DS421_12g363710 [Arachis hypogaea]
MMSEKRVHQGARFASSCNISSYYKRAMTLELGSSLVISSSAGKLMRQKTLAFCLRSAAADDGAVEEVLVVQMTSGKRILTSGGDGGDGLFLDHGGLSGRDYDHGHVHIPDYNPHGSQLFS